MKVSAFGRVQGHVLRREVLSPPQGEERLRVVSEHEHGNPSDDGEEVEFQHLLKLWHVLFAERVEEVASEVGESDGHSRGCDGERDDERESLIRVAPYSFVGPVRLGKCHKSRRDIAQIRRRAKHLHVVNIRRREQEPRTFPSTTFITTLSTRNARATTTTNTINTRPELPLLDIAFQP